MMMEILSKSKNNKYNQYDDNNIFTDNNYKYIFNLKMNKIKEEIKDYIIDKYLNKIIEQNKEIINIKNQLEELTKKYISLVKIMINNNKNYINIKDDKSNNNYISTYKNKNMFLFNNNNQFENNIKNKININIGETKTTRNNTKSSLNNLGKNINFKKINSYISKKKINNINTKINKINYLKELNKKDLKKLNDIKKEIKKTRDSNKFLINKEFHKTIYITENKNKFYNKTNQKGNEKTKTTNKNRNKKNENIIINYLTFNTEESKSHKKKYSIQMNTGLKKRLLKQISTNFNNCTITNLTQDNNEINCSSKKDYNTKLQGFKTFFYKFRKLNNTFNDSFKQNSIEKTKYICNPVFGSFLDRIENN